MPAEEYADLLGSCGLFAAPRRKEGIGLSFLDAMARGAFVLGYDSPTMNEYIRHAETGWLFNEDIGRADPCRGHRGRASGGARAGGFRVVPRGEGRKVKVLAFIENAPILVRRRNSKSMIAAPLAAAIATLTPMKHRLFDS